MLPFLRLKRWVGSFRYGGPPQSCQPSPPVATDGFQPLTFLLNPCFYASLHIWHLAFPEVSSSSDSSRASTSSSCSYLLTVPRGSRSGPLPALSTSPPSRLSPSLCTAPSMSSVTLSPIFGTQIKVVDNFMASPQVTLSVLALLCPQQCRDLMVRPHFVNWNSGRRISKDRRSVLENCTGNVCARINYRETRRGWGTFKKIPSFLFRYTYYT